MTFPTIPAPLTVPKICRNVPFMTSLEVAMITGRHHMNVRQDFKRRLEKQGANVTRFETTYLDSRNRPQPCYAIPGDYLLPIIYTYRGPARERIIQHWSAVTAAHADATADSPVKGARSSFVGKLLEDARARTRAVVSRFAKPRRPLLASEERPLNAVR